MCYLYIDTMGGAVNFCMQNVDCCRQDWYIFFCVIMRTDKLHSVSKETQLFFLDFSWGPGSGSCDTGS